MAPRRPEYPGISRWPHDREDVPSSIHLRWEGRAAQGTGRRLRLASYLLILCCSAVAGLILLVLVLWYWTDMIGAGGS